MPSHQSLSPSPMKRPGFVERTSSNVSLSSSGKQNAKVPRPHVAGRGHVRNVSHGKNLAKLGKINPTTGLGAEAARNHQRQKSGPSSPVSPRPLVKRNSSHVSLPKNTSHTNLRKNHSATTLARNLSHPALKKIGLAPPPKPKEKANKHQDFELGDELSGEEEDEGEWEDSTTQSPELTRNNSKASTPARIGTPNPEQLPPKPPEPHPLHHDRTSSPPEPSFKNFNRSAPDLAHKAIVTPLRGTEAGPSGAHPSLLHQQPRSSRAPPAMSSVSAHASPGNLQRSSSSRSFTHISHADAALTPSKSAQSGSNLNAGSSSADQGVSHFLPGSNPRDQLQTPDDASDYDSPSNFLPNYHPLPSESPEKSKTGSSKKSTNIVSRTQQRMELERRRAAVTAPTTPPPLDAAHGFGSAVSMHSRSNSRGQRSIAGEPKVIRKEYEVASKQLGVTRRFRNPVLESLNRLRDSGTLASGAATPAVKSRPPSRRGGTYNKPNGAAKADASHSFDDREDSPEMSRVSSRGRSGRGQYQRQGSHDDIALSRSKGSYDEGVGDEDDAVSGEYALIRRIWESREVYHRDDSPETGGED